MIERIPAGRDSIDPTELLNAALYELGAIELEPKTRMALLDEVAINGSVQCNGADREQFEAAVLETFELITASREYQLG